MMKPSICMDKDPYLIYINQTITNWNRSLNIYPFYINFYQKQGRKRPLDTPKRMIERREKERKVEV